MTVVIPSHNAARTIVRALDSIAAQKALPRWVIVVDDASSDNMGDVARAHPLAAQTELLVHRLAQNAGAAGARNAGWAMADTAFVAFLDADDARHPLKLTEQIKHMGDGVVMCGHAVVRSSSGERRAAALSRAPEGADLGSQHPAAQPLHDDLVSTASALHPLSLRRSAEPLRGFRPLVPPCARRRKGCEAPCASGHLFQSPYSESGLSRDLSAMERAEREVLERLYHDEKIGIAWYMLARTAAFADWPFADCATPADDRC